MLIRIALKENRLNRRLGLTMVDNPAPAEAGIVEFSLRSHQMHVWNVGARERIEAPYLIVRIRERLEETVRRAGLLLEYNCLMLFLLGVRLTLLFKVEMPFRVVALIFFFTLARLRLLRVVAFLIILARSATEVLLLFFLVVFFGIKELVILSTTDKACFNASRVDRPRSVKMFAILFT
jgi:hypothetical protein